MEKTKDTFFLHSKNTPKPKHLDTSHKSTKGGDMKKESYGMHNKDESQEENSTKKPFDKKTYRYKKYSHRYKLDQWEEKHKKILLKKYQKQLNKNKPDFEPEQEHIGRFVKHPDLLDAIPKEDKFNDIKKVGKVKDKFEKVKNKFEKVKQEKLLKRQEIEKVKEEKRQKLLEYKKKKQEVFKKLSRKTKKGQPVMTGRLELLLEKIQNS